MIGRLRTVVVDCQEPDAMARFYQAVVGGRIEPDVEWTTLVTPDGTRLAFQRSPEHIAPKFPDPKASQQFHLDIQVDDVDDAELRIIALGAARIPDVGQETGDDRFRVYRDPAGHTFCLVWDVEDPDS